MSLSKHIGSLKYALLHRAKSNEKVLITYNILRNEDIIETFLTNEHDILRGYSIATLDESLRKKCLVTKACLKKGMHTKMAQTKIKFAIPTLGHVIHIVDAEDKIESVYKKDSTCVISDIEMENICDKMPAINFFQEVATKSRSYTDEDVLGKTLDGVTNSTIILSSKGSAAADHTEHHNFASLSLLHHGGKKNWFIRAPSQLLPTLMTMTEVSKKHEFPEDIQGVCELSLTHRNFKYSHSQLGMKFDKFEQEPGDIVIIHPGAIHSIENRDANLLEGRNFLPLNKKYLHHMASYKTCKHSEELSGKPMNGVIRKFIEHLPIENFIHFSDPEKACKLELIEYLNKTVKGRKQLQEVLEQIQKSHIFPAWFNELFSHKNHAKEKKLFQCEKCDYSDNNYGNLNRHTQKVHRCKAPENKNTDKCPTCSSTSHAICQKKRKIASSQEPEF